MNYTTEISETDGICSVRVAGSVRRPHDSIALQQLARELGREKGCRCFLFDLRGADIIGGMLETFEAGNVPADTDYSQQSQKVALVYRALSEQHRFLETVAVNRGYSVRVFDRVDTALGWLTEQGVANGEPAGL